MTAAAPIRRLQTLSSTIVLSILVAAVFGALAFMGVELTRSSGRIAALWLPNALLIGILQRDRSGRPGLFIAACFAANVGSNLIVGDMIGTAVALALANSAEIVIATLSARRLFGHEPRIDQLTTLLGLFALSLLAPAISGIVATLAIAPPGTMFDVHVFAGWFLSDSLSMIIVAPIVMTAIDLWRGRRQPTLREIVEWIAVLAFTAAVTSLVFSQSRYPFLFLVCPLVIVAAFRTGIAGTAAATTIICIVASAFTMFDSGPITLVRGDLADKLIALQLFLATTFAVGIPVAAALAGRAALRRDLLENRAMTATMLDNIQEIIFRTDAAGRWVFLNPAWEAITGYSVAESLGWDTTRLLHEDDRAVARSTYPAIVSGELSQARLRQRFYTAAGECRHIEVLVSRLVDDDGRFIGTTGNIRDVSEALRHERELADSEARFRCMAEAAPVGIFRADASGNVTYVNRLWCEKIGLTVEQSLGDGWKAALADDSAFADSPAFSGLHKPGDTHRRVINFRGNDGTVLWLETVNSAEFDASGNITGFVGVLHDITEQRRAIERLTDSERRFQTLADLSPAGIFRTDADGHCTYVNRAWLRITGLADDAWQDEGWSTALHPDDRERVFTGWAEAVSEQRDYRAEFRWVRPDGSYSWVDVLGRPEFDEAGTLQGFIGVNLDITERRHAEEELADRDAQLTLLANNATDAVVRLALDGRCKYASPSTKGLLGVDPKYLVGVQMLDRFHPDDRDDVLLAFARLARGEIDDVIIAYRSELMAQPGVYRWLEAHCGLVRDAGGAPSEIIASIRDVSKNKLLEEQLRQARETAENAASAKAAFLANMSHEIRTPMNGVLGFTELLASTDLNDEQRRHVQLLGESGRAMMRLLNDILDMSKIDAGQMQITWEAVDLRHKLRSCARLMEPVANAKGVALTIDVAPDMPKFIRGDQLRIRQVLLNLIGNAVKFTDDGAITVRAAACLDSDTPMLCIDVRDSGIGIAQDKLAAIFQQFSQADSSIARRFGGTGLGLSISNQLAHLMGGAITVESRPGEGATFTLRLPLVAAEAPAGAATDGGESALDISVERPNVLIAEDHDINQMLMLSLAEAAGFDAQIAGNGAEAIDMIAAAADAGRPFDIVFMDMQMPVVDGLEATRRIRASGIDAARLPIVALTANAYQEDIDACRHAGMQSHLSKPVRARDVKQMIERHVVRSRPAAPAPVEAEGRVAMKASTADLYRQRRQATLDAVASAARHGLAAGMTLADLSDLLHKLAGTAGFFGEAELGSAAADLEGALAGVSDGDAAPILRAGWEKLSKAA